MCLSKLEGLVTHDFSPSRNGIWEAHDVSPKRQFSGEHVEPTASLTITTTLRATVDDLETTVYRADASPIDNSHLEGVR